MTLEETSTLKLGDRVSLDEGLNPCPTMVVERIRPLWHEIRSKDGIEPADIAVTGVKISTMWFDAQRRLQLAEFDAVVLRKV